MHNQFKTQKFKHLMLAMGPRDLNSAPYSPVHCSSHSMTSFQPSEIIEPPVVENSQLFAQRAHSARYAPLVLRQAGDKLDDFCGACFFVSNFTLIWCKIIVKQQPPSQKPPSTYKTDPQGSQTLTKKKSLTIQSNVLPKTK